MRYWKNRSGASHRGAGSPEADLIDRAGATFTGLNWSFKNLRHSVSRSISDHQPGTGLSLQGVLAPLSKAIYRVVSRIVDRRLRPFGRIPIAERRVDDIYIIGFPKSGSNWMQNLAAGLIYGLPPAALPDSLVQELVPDIDYFRHYQRYFEVTVFRSHSLPRPDFRRVIHIVRDPRDVFVSLLHFRRALRGIIVDPAVQLEDQRFSGTAWRNHLESWLSNPYGAEVLLVKYEDLRRDTKAECRRILEFVGVARTEDEIETVVSQSTFQRLREKEEKYGKSNPPRWPRDKTFYRRGQVGSHKDELSQDIERRLLEQVGPALERCGYSAVRGDAP
jgi:Sulfotransferase domain